MDDRLYSDQWTRKFAVEGAPFYFHLSKYREEGVDIPNRIRTAQKFVQAAIRFGAISPEAPLMVFGAGAAGVAAAMTAASSGVPTTILEIRDLPFPQQALCESRWLHPNQYSWPQEGFECENFPSDSKEIVPLSWSADYAHKIAARWAEELAVTRKKFPHLEIAYNRAVTFPEGDLDDKYIHFLEELDPEGDFALFLGTGLSERTSQDGFRGYPFWATDRLSEKFCGLGKPFPTLIVGGGDGALQDLLRLASELHPIQILKHIKDAAMESSDGQSWWKEVETILHGISISRRSNDGDKLKRDAAIYERLASMNSGVWSPVSAALSKILRADFDPRQIQFVFKTTHPPSSFPLNRFLAELLRRQVREQYRHELFASQHHVHKIQTIGDHACAGEPAGCYGHAHRVKFIEGSRTEKERVFNVIVLRMGVPRWVA